jgi:lipid-binding SYLF domain-containing protein
MYKNVKLISVLILGITFNLQAEVKSDTSQKDSEAVRARATLNAENKNDFHKLVDNSATIYSSITNNSTGKVPVSVLNNAKCIAILPAVTTGALIVGITRGKGLASCKNDNESWSQPTAVSFNQGSIGIQAGAKSADIVLYFLTDKAVKDLKKGEIELGGDISVVAGKYNAEVDTSNAGVVVYSHAEGVFAGASLSGGSLGKDQNDLDSYYGKKVNHLALLEGNESPDNSGYASKLTDLFPEITG